MSWSVKTGMITTNCATQRYWTSLSTGPDSGWSRTSSRHRPRRPAAWCPHSWPGTRSSSRDWSSSPRPACGPPETGRGDGCRTQCPRLCRNHRKHFGKYYETMHLIWCLFWQCFCRICQFVKLVPMAYCLRCIRTRLSSNSKFQPPSSLGPPWKWNSVCHLTFVWRIARPWPCSRQCWCCSSEAQKMIQ